MDMDSKWSTESIKTNLRGKERSTGIPESSTVTMYFRKDFVLVLSYDGKSSTVNKTFSILFYSIHLHKPPRKFQLIPAAMTHEVSK